MKLLAFEIDESEKLYLENHLPESLAREYYSDILSLEALENKEDTTHLAVFVYSQVNTQALDKLPNLKAIFTMSTGYDHIDITAAQNRGISVHSVPFYGENTVAEHTFALILALSRQIVPSVARTRTFDFNPAGLEGFDLKGKTLGIIGMGHIGSFVARIAKGFSMNILAYDPFPKPELATKIGFTYASLEELLPQSDIVTLHTTYKPETHHIINQESIQLFKRGSYLINTARGGLVETSALVKGLEDGILAGAGLDVLEEECFIKEEKELLSESLRKTCDLTTVVQDHLLIQDSRVIVTPHNAFNSREALERILETTVTNIASQLENNLVNQVNN
jgi:D-lactate dehydrogenase